MQERQKSAKRHNKTRLDSRPLRELAEVEGHYLAPGKSSRQTSHYFTTSSLGSSTWIHWLWAQQAPFIPLWPGTHLLYSTAANHSYLEEDWMYSSILRARLWDSSEPGVCSAFEAESISYPARATFRFLPDTCSSEWLPVFIVACAALVLVARISACRPRSSKHCSWLNLERKCLASPLSCSTGFCQRTRIFLRYCIRLYSSRILLGNCCPLVEWTGQVASLAHISADADRAHLFVSVTTCAWMTCWVVWGRASSSW